MTSAEPNTSPTIDQRPATRPGIAGCAIGAVGGAFAVLCAFLPWVTIRDSRTGQTVSLDGLGAGSIDGVTALVLGAVALCVAVAGLAGARHLIGHLTLLAVGVVATGVGAYDVQLVLQRASWAAARGGSIAPGAGMYLILLAGIMIGLGGAIGCTAVLGGSVRRFFAMPV